MSSNTYIADALIRHQIYLQRLAGGMSNDVAVRLDELKTLIGNELKKNGGELPIHRLVYIRKQLVGLVERAGVLQDVSPQLKDFVEYEVQYFEDLLQSATSASIIFTSPETVYSTLTTARMLLTSTNGKSDYVSVSQLLERFEEKLAPELERLIQIGVSEGKSTQAIARELLRRVDTRTKREAEAVVRTATNHMAAQARSVVMQANFDMFKGEQYKATLDSRTTILCAGLDGKLLPMGVGPHPPLHWNCRSLRVPIIKDEYGLNDIVGERPAKGAYSTGPVPANTTYNSWLKRQPEWFQEDVLGKKRAALFRSGKVTLDRFVDDNGGIIRLDELRTKDGRLVNERE